MMSDLCKWTPSVRSRHSAVQVSIPLRLREEELTWMDRIYRMKEFKISNLNSKIFKFLILFILSIHFNFFFLKFSAAAPSPASQTQASLKSPAITFADVSATSGLTVAHVSTPEKRF